MHCQESSGQRCFVYLRCTSYFLNPELCRKESGRDSGGKDVMTEVDQVWNRWKMYWFVVKKKSSRCILAGIPNLFPIHPVFARVKVQVPSTSLGSSFQKEEGQVMCSPQQPNRSLEETDILFEFDAPRFFDFQNISSGPADSRFVHV
jgi:hypothetical protein